MYFAGAAVDFSPRAVDGAALGCLGAGRFLPRFSDEVGHIRDIAEEKERAVGAGNHVVVEEDREAGDGHADHDGDIELESCGIDGNA